MAENFEKILQGKTDLKPFEYYDKGSMATIGRNKAVVDLKKFTFGGFFAWFVWMVIHLISLVGFRNRVVLLFNWLWNYVNYNKASRLIIRRYSVSQRRIRTNAEL